MLNKLITTITLCAFLWGHSGLAECVKEVTLLNQGDPSPCRGYLFTPEKELKVRIMNEENKYFQQQVDILNKQINLLNDSLKLQEEISGKEREKAELWRVRAEDSTRKLIDSEDGRGKRDLLFVIGGVLLTLGAGYAASKFWSK